MKKINLCKGAGVLLIAAALIFSTIAVTADTEELSASCCEPNLTTERPRTYENIGQVIIWDNGPTLPGSNCYSSQRDVIYPFLSQVADDFLFEEETVVADFHWYGCFWGGNPFDPCDFEIYIYADDGTGNAPTGGGMGDPSPTAIWSGFYPGVTGLPLDPNGFYSYEVTLDPPFVAQAGEKYWIAAVSVFVFPPQWGWTNTGGIQLHQAVQGFPLLAIPFWTNIDPPVDMAFYLTGEGPEPIPNLDCDGSLDWEDVKPGDTVEGSFTVSNVGDPMSLLDWEIDMDNLPDWGEWSFDPESGVDLTPEAGAVTVDVECIAPDEENTEFEGEIIIVNSEDPDDTCTIPVSLKTPVVSPFVKILELIAQRFPILGKIIYLFL